MATPRLVFTVTLTFVLLAAALAAGAQQTRVYQVGVIMQGGPYTVAIDGLRDGLRELGLEEGKQFVLRVRDAKGDLTSVAAAARDLERERVDLIYAVTNSVTVAVKRATKSVPVVFSVGTDPVVSGLVEATRKPGGRLTGVHSPFTDLTAKRLELLKEMVPGLRRLVTFYNPANPSAQQAAKLARDAARQLNVAFVERRVGSVEELRAGLQALQPGEAEAFFYVSDAMVTSRATLVIDTAKAKRLPTMFHERQIVADGALASYGVSYYAIGRLSAKYVQRVLLGTNPGDLPVEEFNRLHFAINLKTAKALGLTIPPSVLARADEILE